MKILKKVNKAIDAAISAFSEAPSVREDDISSFNKEIALVKRYNVKTYANGGRGKTNEEVVNASNIAMVHCGGELGRGFILLLDEFGAAEACYPSDMVHSISTSPLYGGRLIRMK
jgi:hypothetical protein